MRNINLYPLIVLCAMFIASCAKPISQFQTDQSEYMAPVDIKFNNKSQNADSYIWDFGDGTTSAEAEPTHHYYHSGNYKVTLTAIKDGRKRKSSEIIQVKAPIDCLVEIMTSKGNIVLHLFDDTPKHQENFLKLVNEGFYDSLLFHRVIPGFMIQGGDPRSKDAGPGIALGSGGPGYQISHEIMNEHVHVKGALAAARTNNPEKKSSGSQFYIVEGRDVTDNSLISAMSNRTEPYTPEQKKAYKEHGGTPALDGLYTVFGEVIDGIEVVEEIARVKRDSRDRPIEDVWMVIKVIK